MPHVWFIWSLLLLLIWCVLYLSLRDSESRKEMFIVSLWTSLLGFTEPFFVPEYWNPPSLFNLAANTGFDIESLLFAFGIGGIAVILYGRLFKIQHIKMSVGEKLQSRHSIHLFTLLSAPITFIFLYFITDINPIYSTIIALTIGGVFTWYCRPDLKVKMFVSAVLFVVIYYIYFLTLIIYTPGYVGEVWNFSTISGILVTGVPLEELLFAASFGFIWSSIYEHITWEKIVA